MLRDASMKQADAIATRKVTVTSISSLLLCGLVVFLPLGSCCGGGGDRAVLQIGEMLDAHVKSFSLQRQAWIGLKGKRVERTSLRSLDGAGDMQEAPVVETEYEILLLHRLGSKDYRLEISGPKLGFSMSAANNKEGCWYAKDSTIKNQVPAGTSAMAAFLCTACDILTFASMTKEDKLDIVEDEAFSEGNEKVDAFKFKHPGENVFVWVEKQSKRMIAAEISLPEQKINETVAWKNCEWQEGILFPKMWYLRSSDGRSLGHLEIVKMVFLEEIDDKWLAKETARQSIGDAIWKPRGAAVPSNVNLDPDELKRLADAAKKADEKIREIEKKYPEGSPERREAFGKLDEEWKEVLRTMGRNQQHPTPVP